MTRWNIPTISRALSSKPITLGDDIDNRDLGSQRDADRYPLLSALGKENVDKTTMAAAVIAHEFGHVEDANANPAKFQLIQAYSDLSDEIIREHRNAGLVKGIRGEELANKKNAYLKAFGVKNDRDYRIAVDNPAEKAAIPVIQQRFANTGKDIPKSVQNAITKLQGGN